MMIKDICLFLSVVALFSPYELMAQISFEQVLPTPPAPHNVVDFRGVDYSSIAFADVDGDQDQDVLITGDGVGASQTHARLYINDGNGNFTEVVDNPFEDIQFGSIAFADVDGDSDQDVLITGYVSERRSIAILYINDGEGSYRHASGSFFEGIQSGSVAFADIDGDRDLDVFINGFKSSSRPSGNKLYANDGKGIFSKVVGTPFEHKSFNSYASSVAFADVDGDQDQDVLTIGTDLTNNAVTKLYINDGDGKFSELTIDPFVNLRDGEISFADVDGDQDQDVLIAGSNKSYEKFTTLYINDGKGNYTELIEGPFETVNRSSIGFADVDGDQDQDVIITGITNASKPSANLYINDGSGSFDKVDSTSFDKVYWGSLAFADVDGDQDQDVLITGSDTSDGGASTQLYLNDGSGNFIKAVDSPFEGVYISSVAFADVDGDQDQDVLITGWGETGQPTAKLYRNTTIIIDRPPAFVSTDTIYVQENISGIILNIDAHNGNGGFTDVGITYHLIAYKDHKLFTLGVDGSIAFISSPDYEHPQDTDKNNIYELTVSADDGSNITEQSIVIVIIDKNDNIPSLVDHQSFSLIENAADGSVVGIITATDKDTVTTFQNWSITNGNPDTDLDGQPAFIINDQGEIIVNDADDLVGVSGELHLEVVVSDGSFESQPKIITLQIRSEDHYCDVFVSNIFTPNNDGKNDLFEPILHQRVQNPMLRIYNRHGSLVHEDQVSAQWDGTLGSKSASAGNYFWTLSYICT